MKDTCSIYKTTHVSQEGDYAVSTIAGGGVHGYEDDMGARDADIEHAHGGVGKTI